jgi:hypothetical protein
VSPTASSRSTGPMRTASSSSSGWESSNFSSVAFARLPITAFPNEV